MFRQTQNQQQESLFATRLGKDEGRGGEEASRGGTKRKGN